MMKRPETGSALEALRAASPEDRGRWLQIWREWPEREVFAHPEYLMLFEPAEGEAWALTMKQAGARVLYPFFLRGLDKLPWAGKTGRGRTDVTTPYGYGGPFCWSEAGAPPETESLADAFWAAAANWFRERGAVSEFLRLHLARKELLPYPGAVARKSDNIVRTLQLSPEDLFMNYEHKVRKNVKKARRAGLAVEFDEAGSELEAFCDIYTRTMRRRRAGSYYFFPAEFFLRAVGELKGHCVLIHVRKAARVISSELALQSARRIYSFLGGTLEEFYADRPNDLLKHETALWARERGFTEYVLGGGYSPGDGIFRYKRGFAPEGTAPFYTGTRILDKEACLELTREKQAWHKDKGLIWKPRPGFFPPYRA